MSESTLLATPEGVECALQALENGTPSEVRWTIRSEPGPGGQVNDIASRLSLTGKDREAFVYVISHEDEPVEHIPIKRKRLRDVSYFVDCAALESHKLQLECLIMAVEEPEIEVCDAT